MIIRTFIIVGFILSLIAAAGSFSIYQSYQTEREQRLDAQSNALQLQDAMSTAKADLEQQKSLVADLEGQVENFKKAEKDFESKQSEKDTEIETLKSEIAAKGEAIRQLQGQIENFRKKEQAPAPLADAASVPAAVETLTKPVVAVEAPSLPETPAATTATSWPTPQSSSTSNAVPMINDTVEKAAPSPVSSITSNEASTVKSSETTQSEDSRILTVNRKFNFIVINIGLRDGLRMGDKVQVMQGSSQKALAEIEKIYDKFSAATLLNEDKGNPVREGDAVQKI